MGELHRAKWETAIKIKAGLYLSLPIVFTTSMRIRIILGCLLECRLLDIPLVIFASGGLSRDLCQKSPGVPDLLGNIAK